MARGADPNSPSRRSAETAAQSDPDDISGQSIGDYQIIRKLGQGGMGQVYLAEQISLKRKVALKFLKNELVKNVTALNRFRAEAEAVARINHPNIVQVYTIGEYGGRQFMVLEYVEGMNLRDYLRRKGTVDLPRALLIMRQVAAALQRASETGIVHRDIKPENILLTRKGEVKVADFGLSRVFGGDEPLNLTQTGMTMGTPLYMSPEQVQGNSIDPRSDIYSFGVTCYHMLTGETPFGGQNAFEVALKHVNEKPSPLNAKRNDLPSNLCQLVDRMLAKDPAKRPQTGRDILRDLGSTGASEPDHPFSELNASVTIAAVPTPDGLAPARHGPGSKPWRFIASLVLCLAIGAAARLTIAPPKSTGVNAPASTVESSDEKFLVDMVRRYSSANLSNPETLKLAFRVYTQLGVIYLEQRRWSEAAEFISHIPEHDAALQFLKNLLHGALFSLTDQPQKAATAMRLAFDDTHYQRYLANLNSPPSREAVDLRSLIVDALDRIDQTQRLSGELARVRNESLNYLRRPVPVPAKKAG